MSRGPLATTTLLWCGVVAGPLFVTVFLVAGALRPDYNPMRHPVSSLSLTASGWIQITNFVVAGLLMIAFAIGVRRVLRSVGGAGVKPWLVGAYGVGLLGSGVFITNPLGGYPPGTPDEIVYTWYGVLHDAFAIPVFFGLPVICLAFSIWFWRRRHPAWVVYSLLTAVVFFTTFILASLGFTQEEGWVEVGGLYQRVTITLGSVWFTLLAAHLFGVRERSEKAPNS